MSTPDRDLARWDGGVLDGSAVDMALRLDNARALHIYS